MFQLIDDPKEGAPIRVNEDQSLEVPDNPIIPFITGDGTGRDIMKATQPVLDAAVEKAYGGKRKLAWFKIYAGDEARFKFHPNLSDDELSKMNELDARRVYLPEDTFEAIRKFKVALKGPLTTPVGGGIRSLNVTLRQVLDLYACVRPVKYYGNIPSPVRHPENMNIVIFRENTEDVYSGIEWESGTETAKKLISILNQDFCPALGKTIREDSGVGIKPISPYGSKRLIRMAIRYALKHNKPSVTLVHKGNIMKFTEGAFRNWGYELAREEFRQETVSEREWGIIDMKNRHPEWDTETMARELHKAGWEGFNLEDATETGKQKILSEIENVLKELYESHGGENLKKKLVIKDRIADSMFQQLLTRTSSYSVIATTNLNGDYLSDAAVAQVGGLGLAAGANIGDGVALFEATHGTAPKYADLDVINPGAVILSGVMMLEHLGWQEAADLVVKALDKTLRDKTVTYDLHRLMVAEGYSDVKKLKCSEFGQAIIANMDKV
ncbi:MAG: isocitrate dehydrogenase (NADP(+)) [Planctomycetota bacterium]|nr:MAG: isocitrate dehydrogenase (NADP(+)) [Planctomycetota bacterium]